MTTRGRRVLLPSLLLAAALVAPARAEVILLTPGPEGEDSSPYSFLPSQPRGNRETQYAFLSRDEFGFDHSFETFVRFALPADLVGPGEAIVQAVFFVYFSFDDNVFGEGSDAPGELHCHEVLEPWSEASLNWNNKPDYGPAFDAFTGIEGPGLMWCNVTQLVSDWVSGARPNHGIALTNPTDRILGFWSFETPAGMADPIYLPGLAVETAPAEAADADGDAVPDAFDVCLLDPDPQQADTDHDGYGNACDPDLDGDGAVGLSDFAAVRMAFGSALGDARYDADADFDADGAVGLTDFGLLRSRFGSEPGPSGLACAGAPPCP
jgi:hypothetical protein